MAKQLLKKLPFDIAARLPLQLGRDSIGSSTAAITELIKNSYDANAENVRVSFINRNAPTSRIQIEDDGDGMDLETLEKVWLRIGTENKTQREYSLKKLRVFTGAKGLGRLGIDRLCKKLILQTKTEDMNHVLELHIDWSSYTQQDVTIADIKHNIFSVPFKAESKHSDFFRYKNSGTRLILSGLNESWKDSRIADLKDELSLLVSPFSAINDFNIELSSGIKDIDGPLANRKLLSAAVWTITAEIDVNNQISATFSHSQTKEKISLDPVDWNEWLPERGKIPQCGPLSLEIYYIPQPDSKITTSLSMKDWRATMPKLHGVRIYRDEFRVRPYGEPTGRGDWLDFGLRKASSPGGIRQGGWRVGPMQVIGAVFISRLKNQSLNDQTNREGLVETEAFFDLRAFALKIIQEFEVLASEHARQQYSEQPLEEAVNNLNESIKKSQKAVSELSKAVNTDTDITKDDFIRSQLLKVEQFVEETKKASEKEREAYTTIKEELEREKDTLANLASLGILTVCFGHEAKEFCNLAAIAAVELKETYESGKFMVTPDLEETLTNDLDIIIDSTKFIRSYAAFSLGNVSKEKRIKGKVNIHTVALRVLSALNDALSRQNISVDLTSIEKDAVISNAYEIDWESIFINMISNSIWAMAKTPADKRTIQISARRSSNSVEIKFKDSGKGLEKGTEEFIFNPMYSTRRDEKGNTIGTGMGLSIVATFIKEHSSGNIKAHQTSDLGGAEFVITVPSMEKQ